MQRQDRDCLLRSAYRLIEPDAAPVACGRCEACRRQGVSPPGGLRSDVARFAWPPAETLRPILPRGVILVAPEGSQDRLIGRLARVGIEQIVAPEAEAPDIAAALAAHPVQYGFVQPAEDWLRRDGVLPDLPTAFLPPALSTLGPWVRELERLANARPHQHLILVADPASRVDGRALHQIASQHAPYDEAILDEFFVAFQGTGI